MSWSIWERTTLLCSTVPRPIKWRIKKHRCLWPLIVIRVSASDISHWEVTGTTIHKSDGSPCLSEEEALEHWHEHIYICAEPPSQCVPIRWASQRTGINPSRDFLSVSTSHLWRRSMLNTGAEMARKLISTKVVPKCLMWSSNLRNGPTVLI